MAIRNALPFEFPSRWQELREFFSGLNDKGVNYLDERDRDLEDFLAGLDDDVASAVSGKAQLLCMTASADSIASGGDTVTFGTIAAQHAFTTVSGAGSGWTHPVGGVYVLTYEHVWDSYTGGGTIAVQIDGVSSAATVLASGSGGVKGRGSLAYVATEGSVGSIKVTQTSGSAQTCSATVWVAISDPTSVAAGNTVELYIDGVLADSSTDALTTVDYTSSTVFVGELAGSVPAVSDYYFDSVSFDAGTGELLGNAGFESVVAGTGTSTSVTTGNWYAYQQGTAAVAVSTLQASAGTQSGRVDINSTGGSQNGWFFQDVTMPTEGAGFDLEAMVYPTAGTQYVSVLFDWDRSGASDHACSITVSPSETTLTAFGVTVTGAALPQNQWSKVRAHIAAQKAS